ncbi:MAG: CPBP family intramembrane metalloprotease, partial [Clostridia bacterium]|nr:CPBP family intramembrane metalloprotease [Clostridia bacterium]
MNNQNIDIKAKIEALQEEKPWLELYEIEAIIAEETGIDVAEYMKNQPAEAAPQKNSNYIAISADTSGKYGAYEDNIEQEQTQPVPEIEQPAKQPELSAAEKAALAEREAAKKAVEKRARKTIAKNIRHEMDNVGFTLLIYVILSVGLCAALAIFLVAFTGKDIAEVSAFVSRPEFSAIFEGAILFLGLALPFILYIYIHKLPVGDMVPLHKLRSGELLPMIFIGLGAVMLQGYLTNLITTDFSLTGANYRYNSVSLGTTMGEFLISFACLSLVPAVVETFVFNGVILQVLRRRGGDGYALIMSSLLHAILCANFEDMVGAFVVSLVLGYMVIYSGSLIPAAATRMIEMFLFLGITQLGFVMPSLDTVVVIDIGVTAILIGASKISIIIILGRFPNFFQIKKGDGYLKLSEKVRISLLRPTVLIIMIYSLAFAF